MSALCAKTKVVTFLWLAFCSQALKAQQVKVDNSYDPEGNGFRWRVYVEEGAPRLNLIKCVEYTLYPSFPNPVRKVCDPRDGFALEERGRREFTILVRIDWRNGSATSQSYMLDLHSHERSSPTIPRASPSIQDPQHLFRKARPEGLALLPSGIVILDGNQERLLQARITGLAAVTTQHLQSPIDIAPAKIDGHEFILLISKPRTGQSELMAYTTDGVLWNWWPPSEPGEFAAIAADPSNDTIYLGILTTFSFDIVRLSAQSVLSHQPHPFSSVSGINIQQDNPSVSYGLAADSANQRLYVASSAGDFFSVDLKASHSHPTVLLLPRKLGLPTALACDPAAQTLYVGAGNHLWAVDVGSSPAKVTDFVPSHHFKNVSALAMDSNHRLWVGDSGAHALYQISPDAQTLGTLPRWRGIEMRVDSYLGPFN
jgi:hypothetical protein